MKYFLSFFCLASSIVLFAQKPEFGTESDAGPSGCGMAFSGDTLFATGGSESFSKNKMLAAFKLTDPSKPEMISAISLKGFPQDLVVSEGIAYLADGLRLFIIDVKNPAAMKVLSETRIAESPEFGPQGIALTGKTLYLAARRNGILTYDVSNPIAPQRISQLKTPFARGVATWKNGFISADDAGGITVSDGKKILDCKQLPSGCAMRVRVADGKVFVANGNAFLSVFTIAENGMLSPCTVFDSMPGSTFYGSYCYDVLPENGKVLLSAGENGILEIDITDSQTPKCVNSIRELSYPMLKAVIARNDYIYANDNGNLLYVISRQNGIWRLAGSIALKLPENVPGKP